MKEIKAVKCWLEREKLSSILNAECSKQNLRLISYKNLNEMEKRNEMLSKRPAGQRQDI